MPKLIVSLPDGGESSFDLEADVITVGRTDDNIVHIDDASVSSHHATLTHKDGGYILDDLDSTNGTRVNGEPTKHAVLDHGDRIRFGKVEARYMSENASEARPLPTAENPTAELAEASTVPSDFSNASSFKRKVKKSDTGGKALMAFAIVSVLAFGAALASVFMLQPPQ